MNKDNRDTQRHRTLKGAKIVLNEGFSTFSCTVRNMSDTGAKLIVQSIVGVPKRFELALDDGRRFQCETAWHTEKEIGVRFIS